MPHQRDAIPELLRICTAIHDPCAVVLIGSVARHTAHAESDIDLNLIFPGDTQPLNLHSYVTPENRWQLTQQSKVQGFRIDVAWETENRLRERVTSDEVQGCWPFSWGEILHDPKNLATESRTLARRWFEANPEIDQQIQETYDEAKR